jgi:hypothetical protein
MGNKINKKYSVLTNNGYSNFIGIKKSYAELLIHIKLENGLSIKSTKNHVYPTNMGLFSSEELVIGLELNTKQGKSKITNIETIEYNDYVYDLLEVYGDNLYYANDILTHNCSFIGSGDSVIDDKHKARQEKYNVKDPIRKEWIDGNMWIWEDPIKDHQYILAADPSSGSSDDFAGLCIWDFTTGNQVAEYHGKVAPDVLGEIAKYYGESYNAFIVVDITGGWGASVVLKLIELGYNKKMLYYDVAVGIDSIENNKALQKFMDKGKLPGLNFQKNRNTIISKLEEGIRLDSFKIRSKRALAEIETFVFINGRADHMKGYHDDLLMSIAMCCFVGATSFKDLEKSKGQAKAMINSWSVETHSIEKDSVLGEVVNNNFYTDQRTDNNITQEQFKENLWLFSGMKGFKK